MKDNLKEIVSLGAIANATLELDKLLGLVVDSISRLVRSEGGSVLLLEGSELVFKFAIGKKGHVLVDRRLPRGRSIAWWVIDYGDTYICDNPSTDRYFSGTVDRDINFETRNLIAVPIKLDDEIIGVMEAVNKKDGLFGSNDRLILESFADLVAVAIRNARIFERLNRVQEQRISEMVEEYQLIGVSQEIQNISESIPDIASKANPILLVGEAGVGKEVVARRIHFMGPRIDGPFIKIVCPTFPERNVEIELFGFESREVHKVIMGDFERARGGTIFLEEISGLSIPIQERIVQIIENHTFSRIGSPAINYTDARIIISTKYNIEELIAGGTFSKQLYNKVSTQTIKIPPLRERTEDINPLVKHFIQKLRKKFPHPVKKITAEAMEILQKYPWTGNVRELENIIERIVVSSAPEIIGVDDLPPSLFKKDSQFPRYISMPDGTRRLI